MELTQLKQFKAIAECENLTEASERLHISQPALSMSLKKLEDELGVQLFDRVKKYIYLNEAGRTVLTYVNHILHSLKEMTTAIEPFKDIKQNSVKITSSLTSVLRYFIPLVNKHYPNALIDSMLVDEKEIGSSLIDGFSDIALSPRKINNIDVESIPLFEERFYIGIPFKHPYYTFDDTNISLSDFDGQEFLRLRGSGYLSKYIDDSLNKNKIHFNFYYQNDPLIYYEMLKDANYLITTTTLGNLYYFNKETLSKYRFVPITYGNSKFTIYMAYQVKNKKSLQSYLDFLVTKGKELV